MEQEMAAVKKHWDSLYEIHVTQYRDDMRRQFIQYAKARAINADIADGRDPLHVSTFTAGMIRDARKPVTRKQKKNSEPKSRKRKK